MFIKKNEESNPSCEYCMHYAVCGHKEHMKMVLEQVNALEIKKTKFIEITAKCTEFLGMVEIPKGGSSVQRFEITKKSHQREITDEQMIKTPPQTWSATHRAYAGTTIEVGGDSGGQDSKTRYEAE